jgi:hypothetical protein
MATRKAKQDDLRYEQGQFSAYDAKAQKFVPIDEREAARIQQKTIRGSHRGNAEQADWRNASDAAIAGVVRAVTRLGFAVRFGYTRDGGALAVGIIGDGKPYTEYVRPTEDVDVYLDGLAADFTAAPDNEFAARRQG